ncbi:beta-ketoacyl-ACP synthase III [Jonesia denitrificans]|uniref:Beta-ketoacyl-[acyl-carrier-protein] synthase III n=1 Tax=Jonesia denitrificans (strain ATCC 14870 / DSM 20603 / BCRC 15368 / CIP 55.134 / JCM 11481 / NBRC 15587 / NCTC 10816 / Prevot 55134) TaxID=471856 RepID=C7R4Z4_JONDD|nr:beta-ketoacyl-ACP synthase III [Jonesia denitrificans]ACV09164.1 3-oxoacyl-(acyl-carrier-protein) synthase III [Jonesia denitrificans DSM 20603]AVJ53328.1 ketoacyl-ACP synthase III [Jonesia denitrificans]QXB44103.1 ketoacyl-ACP synthase III [Jonesia denitrificans]SQH21391.1 3-oxoacyl-[acyl-carrier-protein] synthase 3 [Jonesia denitrificans]
MATLTQAQGSPFSRIYGFGAYRGDNVVTNDDIAGPIDSSDEWIRQRTGIVTRRRAHTEESVIDLAVRAARDVLATTGIDPSDIGAVIMSTVTYFHQTPAAAAIVAEKIGATPAAAFDISAACAGYTYGVAQADALVRAGTARYVLVIGAEKMSDFIDPTDRSISFLLGDGAGAVIVGPSDQPGIGKTVWGADGTKANLIYQTHSWQELNANPDLGWPTLRQDGPSVFKWASFTMAPIAKEAIAAAGLTPDDIDVFVPHQANMRIIDQLIKQIKLPDHVVVGRDIADTGNTSAASIPLATHRLLSEGQAKSGDLCLQIGFGAGLAYAAQVIALP